MSVEVYQPLAPGLHIEEGIARLLQAECGAIIANGLGQIHERSHIGLWCREGSEGVAVGVLDAGHLPVLERPGDLVAIHIGCEGDVPYESLEVLDGSAKVDASHGFHEEGQAVALLSGRKLQGALVLHPVHLTHILAVDESLHKVVPVNVEGRPCGYLRQVCTINHGAIPHVHLLEGDGLTAGSHAVHAHAERGYQAECHAWDTDEPSRSSGDSGKFLRGILLHGLPQQMVFLGGAAILIDGCIVIIRGHVGSEAW